jgi:hypothetical protein
MVLTPFVRSGVPRNWASYPALPGSTRIFTSVAPVDAGGIAWIRASAVADGNVANRELTP